jgi:hypothetical protein
VTDTTREPDVEQAAIEMELAQGASTLMDIAFLNSKSIPDRKSMIAGWLAIFLRHHDVAQRQQERALRAAGQELYRVGDHNAACAVWDLGDTDTDEPCDCGLEAARQAWREASR